MAKSPGPGHNSNDVGGIAAEHLRQFIARIEALEDEKRTIGEDIKQVYAEAKGNGFDTKIIRQIIRMRKMSEADRQEQEALLDLYMQALGMLSDTPLGQAAMRAGGVTVRAAMVDPETGEIA